MLTYAGVCGRMLTYAGVCGRMQDDLRMTLEDVMTEFTDTLLEEWTNGKYADVCWRMLTYARGVD